MTKRFIATAFPLIAASLAMGQQIRTTLNGTPVQFNDVQPVSVNGRVLVPVRGIFEQMGVNVGWDAADQRVYADGNGRNVVLYIGKRIAQVNGHDVSLDVPATTYNGRTMVPLRFISEAMGATVNWDAPDNLVAITTATMGNEVACQTYTPDQGGQTLTDQQRAERRARHEQALRDQARAARNGTETTGVRTQPIPAVVLRANTVIPVILNNNLSSNDAAVGDAFTANVDTRGSNTYDGIPSGTVIEGHVDSVRPMTNSDPGVLGLTFDRFRFPDGRTMAIDGSLIGLDSKSVITDNGRIVAKQTANRNMKYVGVGAGAGALLAVVTKGNVITTAVIGAALGYLYDQSQAQHRKDVTLSSGTRFGVVLNRDEAIPGY